jgi:hypothetical protein
VDGLADALLRALADVLGDDAVPLLLGDAEPADGVPVDGVPQLASITAASSSSTGLLIERTMFWPPRSGCAIVALLCGCGQWRKRLKAESGRQKNGR